MIATAATFLKANKLVAIAALVAFGLVSWGGFKLWDWWDDRQAIAKHDAKVTAKVVKRAAEADRAAGQAKRTRDDAMAAAEDNLKDVINDAKITGRNGHDALADALCAESEDCGP